MQADPKVLVVSQDEAHFTQRSTVTAQLVKRGSRPRVASYPGRAKVSFSGFVELGADNGRLFIDSPERFTWETTIALIRGYLATLAPEDKRQIWMILDKAPWHRKAKRLIREQTEYQDIRERVSFLDIPPYSPDLNPIEQVWRVARREVTHNRFFPSIDEEKRELEAWFAELATPNQKLASLCTFQFQLEKQDHS